MAQSDTPLTDAADNEDYVDLLMFAKMMERALAKTRADNAKSDTPLTDANRWTAHVTDSVMRRISVDVVHASFAVELERALAEKTRELEGTRLSRDEWINRHNDVAIANERKARYIAELEQQLAEARSYLHRVRLAKSLTEAVMIANECAIDAALESSRTDTNGG